MDYRAGRATCYMPGGDTLDLRFERPEMGIADAFDADAVRGHPRRTARKGDVPGVQGADAAGRLRGLHGLDRGRHFSYLGRRAQTQVERFPD
ncbi:hypothetical protein [Pelomonas cellulosilytica]|uniref:Uncharacterized protein n=1 Tax=Pelomonas cellulosilytica TaxID=2906762 RepID=A0ABS8XTV0_9BURK|nr:hypothetical protein [Pelomonas sp. P8]MCE4555293.1 hypothetical protein [Pelomonas sp. P8]